MDWLTQLSQLYVALDESVCKIKCEVVLWPQTLKAGLLCLGGGAGLRGFTLIAVGGTELNDHGGDRGDSEGTVTMGQCDQ